MHSKPQVLLAGRSKPAITKLASAIEPASTFEIDTRHIENGHSDPLWGLSYVPDVVVMVLNERGHHDLSALIDEPSTSRPPMIVLAEQGDAQTMRLAMQAGARDFLLGVVAAEDLLASIGRVSAQTAKQPTSGAGELTVFVNAKGGSGATFIAANVAHALRSVSGRSTALLSLDMQFESLAQHFDVKLRHDLLQVLETVDDLDAVALDAYMTQHASGLRLLATHAEAVSEYGVDKGARIDLLLDKMTTHYDHVVVDVPRRLDGNVVPALQRANRVVLVVQQTLSHLRDATRMLQIFNAHGIPDEHVLVAVNRFEKRSSISLDDIRRTLRSSDLITVPSDYQTVAESINLGIPMYEHARSSAVTRALVALQIKLDGGPAEAPRGFLGKAFSTFLRKQA